MTTFDLKTTFRTKQQQPVFATTTTKSDADYIGNCMHIQYICNPVPTELELLLGQEESRLRYPSEILERAEETI